MLPMAPLYRQLMWTPVELQADLGGHMAGTLISSCKTHSPLDLLASLSGNSHLPGQVNVEAADTGRRGDPS